ncbi:MAG TPA: serine hydrolase [Candidatus Paceibacterota bacterium]|nr:serine hydrolase [Candidatus Paceibacterota bacterium]
MDTSELQVLARHGRFMREAGIALLLSSVVLILFLFVPMAPKSESAPAPVVTTTPVPDAYAQVPIAAKAAVVYDLTTKQVLFGKNADAQLPLASLTKLLTVYAALTQMAPSTPITISETAAAYEAPHLFHAGEVLTLADLARLTLTASLNDGASAIAEVTAQRERVSTQDMLANAASALGLVQTYAVNGSGLDESTSVSGGYGSARDLAVLAGALVEKAPDIARATTEETATAVSEGGTRHTVKNTNPTVINTARLLLSKTGFTDIAGGNLAIVFDAGIGHPIAVVVLGSDQTARFTDANALVAATLAHFSGMASL